MSAGRTYFSKYSKSTIKTLLMKLKQVTFPFDFLSLIMTSINDNQNPMRLKSVVLLVKTHEK